MWSLWMTSALVFGLGLVIAAVPPLYLTNEFHKTLYVGISIPGLAILAAIFFYFMTSRPLRKLAVGVEETLKPQRQTDQQKLVEGLEVDSYHSDVRAVNYHVKDLLERLLQEQQKLQRLQWEIALQEGGAESVTTDNNSFSTIGSSGTFQTTLELERRRNDQKSMLVVQAASTASANSSPQIMDPESTTFDGADNNNNDQRPGSLVGATIFIAATNNSSTFSPSNSRTASMVVRGHKRTDTNAPFGQADTNNHATHSITATGGGSTTTNAASAAAANNDNNDDDDGSGDDFQDGDDEIDDWDDLTSCCSDGEGDEFVVAQKVVHRMTSKGSMHGSLRSSASSSGFYGSHAALAGARNSAAQEVEDGNDDTEDSRLENSNRYSACSLVSEGSPHRTTSEHGSMHGSTRLLNGGGGPFGATETSVVMEGSALVPTRSPRLGPVVTLSRGSRFNEDNRNIALFVSQNKNENLIAYEASWNQKEMSPSFSDKEKPLEGYRLVLDPKSLESRKNRGKADAPARSQLGVMELKMAYGFDVQEAPPFHATATATPGSTTASLKNNVSFTSPSATGQWTPPDHDQFSILFKAVKKKSMTLGFEYVKLLPSSRSSSGGQGADNGTTKDGAAAADDTLATATACVIPTLKMPLSKDKTTRADSSFSSTSQMCIMEKIYIHTKVGGWSPMPSVEYMELHGFCVMTGEKIVERVIP